MKRERLAQARRATIKGTGHYFSTRAISTAPSSHQPKDRYQEKIREIFQRCQINIPLLDAINQIPAYAKFLKELCTVKRRLNVKKKAFMTEQVSSIVQQPHPYQTVGTLVHQPLPVQ